MSAVDVYDPLAGGEGEGAGVERRGNRAPVTISPPELYRPIIMVSCGFLFCEYTFVPISYVLGSGQQASSAHVIQATFLIVTMSVQWVLYKKIEAYWNAHGSQRDRDAFRELLQPLRDLSGVPVARLNCFGISEVKYLLLSLSPNFINVLASAVYVGSSAQKWAGVPEAQMDFANRWAPVPVVGWLIGHNDLPTLLAYLLVWTCLVHACSVMYSSAKMLNLWNIQSCFGRCGEKTLINTCDGANMLFVGKVLARREKIAAGVDAEAHGGRYFATFSTKVLLLWGKISLLTIIIDHLQTSELFDAWQAILLGFYSVVPLAVDYFKMMNRFRKQDRPLKILLWNSASLPFIFAMLVVLPSHVAGIVFCPSHDFSLWALQCTAREGNRTSIRHAGA